ncbi:DUF397 domain-containing protein [Nocardiopsis sp. RSe5-2]|uniref:DUF397 domain-containing protein n=1 Tax=Nocardiopsis endophytica TaxID=3018445 RepID=A0ABT4U2K9_9ACTN|nr:DUF397 domain-containing protein [Nocardiopsis endophytica]MDA2811187.1 DUF397 domain-containing protein [Nocardiopsis endophytica]
MSEWHKSSYSANGANCVEVREHAQGADVRDTRHRAAGHLSFSPGEWRAFLLDLKSDRF